jgi:hypothetical protein
MNKLVLGPARDGGSTRVPVLKIRDPATGETMATAHDNDSKAKVFYDLFFPPQLDDVDINPRHMYPDPLWTHEPISDEGIHRAIHRLKPFKGTSPDPSQTVCSLNPGWTLSPTSALSTGPRILSSGTLTNGIAHALRSYKNQGRWTTPHLEHGGPWWCQTAMPES